LEEKKVNDRAALPSDVRKVCDLP